MPAGYPVKAAAKSRRRRTGLFRNGRAPATPGRAERSVLHPGSAAARGHQLVEQVDALELAGVQPDHLAVDGHRGHLHRASADRRTSPAAASCSASRSSRPARSRISVALVTTYGRDESGDHADGHRHALLLVDDHHAGLRVARAAGADAPPGSARARRTPCFWISPVISRSMYSGSSSTTPPTSMSRQSGVGVRRRRLAVEDGLAQRKQFLAGGLAALGDGRGPAVGLLAHLVGQHHEARVGPRMGAVQLEFGELLVLDLEPRPESRGDARPRRGRR